MNAKRRTRNKEKALQEKKQPVNEKQLADVLEAPKQAPSEVATATQSEAVLNQGEDMEAQTAARGTSSVHEEVSVSSVAPRGRGFEMQDGSHTVQTTPSTASPRGGEFWLMSAVEGFFVKEGAFWKGITNVLGAGGTILSVVGLLLMASLASLVLPLVPNIDFGARSKELLLPVYRSFVLLWFLLGLWGYACLRILFASLLTDKS